MLTDEEGSYFRDMESLFNQPGWTRLVKELDASIDGVDVASFWGAKSYEEILVLRAKLEERRTLRDYPSIIEQRRADTIAQRVMQRAEEMEGLGALE